MSHHGEPEEEVIEEADVEVEVVEPGVQAGQVLVLPSLGEHAIASDSKVGRRYSWNKRIICPSETLYIITYCMFKKS